MTLQFTNTGPDTWSYSGYIGSAANTVGTGTITFNSTGAVSNITGNTMSVTTASTGLSSGAASPQAIKLDLSGMTQYSAASQVQCTNQDGFAAGSLNNVTVDTSGNVNAVFSNGQTRLVAQLAVANFANPSALAPGEHNVYTQTADTGSPQVVEAGTAGAGTIQAQALEESNVDLASQLTQLIVLQRSYEASAKTVSTADQMLQDALNLKQS
jgi:flagellar hook protein FlgE